MAEEVMKPNESLSRRTVGVRPSPREELTVGELESQLALAFPPKSAEAWDRNGLTVGNPNEVVTAVAVALDPTPRAVALAAKRGANVLVTHHPPYLEAPRSFSPDIAEAGLGGSVVWQAARDNVALMNFHTCLDGTIQAGSILPSLLNLQFNESWLQLLGQGFTGGYGSICSVAADDTLNNLGQLAARATSVFGYPPRMWGDPRQNLGTIVCALGSAGSLLPACLKRGVDTLVCGEIHYHDALEGSLAGLGIIEIGHDISELPLAVLLIDAIMDVGISRDRILAIDQSGHWSYPDAVRL